MSARYQNTLIYVPAHPVENRENHPHYSSDFEGMSLFTQSATCRLIDPPEIPKKCRKKKVGFHLTGLSVSVKFQLANCRYRK